jgi:hypothetical protein
VRVFVRNIKVIYFQIRTGERHTQNVVTKLRVLQAQALELVLGFGSKGM